MLLLDDVLWRLLGWNNWFNLWWLVPHFSLYFGLKLYWLCKTCFVVIQMSFVIDIFLWDLKVRKSFFRRKLLDLSLFNATTMFGTQLMLRQTLMSFGFLLRLLLLIICWLCKIGVFQL